MKGDVVVGLREICIPLARFIWRRLSFIVGNSVSAFRVKLGTNDLNYVDVPLSPTHSLTIWGWVGFFWGDTPGRPHRLVCSIATPLDILLE